MAAITDFFKRIKPVRRPSSTLTKVVVCTTAALCICVLGTLAVAVQRLEAQTEDLRSKAAAMEQENAVLEDRIQNADTVQGVQEIAEAELDLVDPNSVIFHAETQADAE